MRATLPYIKERFAHYNALCFDSELPPVEIRIGRATGTVGQFVYPVNVPEPRSNTWRHCFIRMSAAFDLKEDVLDDVLIHEMIHLHIWYHSLRDATAHGPLFRRLMEDINLRHSRHITVSHKVRRESDRACAQSRQNYICVSHWKDGRLGLTVMASTRVFEIYREVNGTPEVTRVEWFWSSDEWFSRFRRSMSFKAYVLSREDYERYLLSGALRCRCDGRRFGPE